MSGISPKQFNFHQDTKQFKAGEYLIVDPCYVIGGDPFWGEFCNYCFPDGEKRDPISVTIGKHEIVCWGTAYGDGCYPVTDGERSGEAGVDAGMLSVVPMEFIKENNLETNLGVIVTLNKASIPEVDEGDLTLGNISALTSDEANEDVCSQCGGGDGDYLNYDGVCSACAREDEE